MLLKMSLLTDRGRPLISQNPTLGPLHLGGSIVILISEQSPVTSLMFTMTCCCNEFYIVGRLAHFALYLY